MKKILLVTALMLGIIICNQNSDQVVIPSNAIRFRVIASSDETEDQIIKNKVKENLQIEVRNVLNSTDSIEQSREKLQSNIDLFSNSIEQTLSLENKEKDYKINYGMNYFPEKTYKGVIYPEGEYESLVVTLGNGKGSNFWCILFPPLCLLEAEETAKDEVEYKSFVKEVLDKHF